VRLGAWAYATQRREHRVQIAAQDPVAHAPTQDGSVRHEGDQGTSAAQERPTPLFRSGRQFVQP
jgi:hypothetical protein